MSSIETFPEPGISHKLNNATLLPKNGHRKENGWKMKGDW